MQKRTLDKGVEAGLGAARKRPGRYSVVLCVVGGAMLRSVAMDAQRRQRLQQRRRRRRRQTMQRQRADNDQRMWYCCGDAVHMDSAIWPLSRSKLLQRVVQAKCKCEGVFTEAASHPDSARPPCSRNPNSRKLRFTPRAPPRCYIRNRSAHPHAIAQPPARRRRPLRQNVAV